VTVEWVGESPFWTPGPRHGHRARFTMPLVEDAVLRVAAMNGRTRHVSLPAAINCSSRLALRVALATTGLNPEWWPFHFGGAAKPRVLKAPSSALGSGVRHFRERIEEVAQLEAVAPELAQFGVVEELVEGAQYEGDGFVLGGKVTFFHPLAQSWRDERIVAYRRCDPPAGFHEAVGRALRAAGVDDAPFCAELRYQGRRWVLIELHARLGEDAGLARKMWPSGPLRAIERAVRAVVSTRPSRR
jgi:hypothetical protein